MRLTSQTRWCSAFVHARGWWYVWFLKAFHILRTSETFRLGRALQLMDGLEAIHVKDNNYEYGFVDLRASVAELRYGFMYPFTWEAEDINVKDRRKS